MKKDNKWKLKEILYNLKAINRVILDQQNKKSLNKSKQL